MSTRLARFEKSEVASVGIKIGGAGTGLSDALRVDPAEYPRGARLNLLLVVEVDEITYKKHNPKDEDDSRLRRVHHVKPETALFLDDDIVANALQQHRDSLKQLEDQQRLDVDVDADGDGTDAGDAP